MMPDQQPDHSTRRFASRPVQRLVAAMCTVCGLGRVLRRGGGTLGALAALPLGGLLAWFGLGQRLLVVSLLVAGGTLAAQIYVRGGDVDDPQEIVLDELLGCLLALQWAAWRLDQVLLAFVLFRLLDIVKPWPINALERRVKGGVGVVLDDLVAGLFAGLLVWVYRLVS